MNVADVFLCTVIKNKKVSILIIWRYNEFTQGEYGFSLTRFINRHIDIPPVFLQLKHSPNLNNSHRRAPTVNNPAAMTTTHSATTNQIPQSTKESIRRS